MNWIIVAIAIVLLVILLFFTKIRVFFNYYHGNDNDDLKIEFRALFGLIKYKVHVPLIKVDDDSSSIVVKSKVKGTASQSGQKSTKQITPKVVMDSLDNTKVLLKHVVGLHKIIRKFLKTVQVKNFKWDTEVGIGDAASTGMLTGAFWTVKGSFIGFISTYMRLMEMPQVSVVPNFQNSVIITKIQCMFQFRIGQAIFAAIKLFKFWRGGRPNFRPISQPIVSENKSNSL